MNKASGGDGIPVELFQILEDDAVKVLHWVCQQIWKTQQWPQDWKWLVFIPTPKKGNAKECSNYRKISLISHTSKVMLKILQARLKQYVNCELPNVQVGLEKAEEPEIKLPTSIGSSKKQETSRKASTSALLTMPKSLTLCTTTNCGKFLKRWEYQTTQPASWDICMQVRKQPLGLDMEQQTGSKLGKKEKKMKLLSRVRLFAVACTRLLHPWDFLGKSTGVGCYFLLQGIFPTQGLNPGLLHCRQTLWGRNMSKLYIVTLLI